MATSHRDVRAVLVVLTLVATGLLLARWLSAGSAPAGPQVLPEATVSAKAEPLPCVRLGDETWPQDSGDPLTQEQLQGSAPLVASSTVGAIAYAEWFSWRDPWYRLGRQAWYSDDPLPTSDTSAIWWTGEAYDLSGLVRLDLTDGSVEERPCHSAWMPLGAVADAWILGDEHSRIGAVPFDGSAPQRLIAAPTGTSFAFNRSMGIGDAGIVAVVLVEGGNDDTFRLVHLAPDLVTARTLSVLGVREREPDVQIAMSGRHVAWFDPESSTVSYIDLDGGPAVTRGGVATVYSLAVIHGAVAWLGGDDDLRIWNVGTEGRLREGDPAFTFYDVWPGATTSGDEVFASTLDVANGGEHEGFGLIRPRDGRVLVTYGLDG